MQEIDEEVRGFITTLNTLRTLKDYRSSSIVRENTRVAIEALTKIIKEMSIIKFDDDSDDVIFR